MPFILHADNEEYDQTARSGCADLLESSFGANVWGYNFSRCHSYCRMNEVPHTTYWKILILKLGCQIIFRGKNGWTICKQWRPWSDAAFCGVWSGSALFAYNPLKVSRLQWVNGLIYLTLWTCPVQLTNGKTPEWLSSRRSNLSRLINERILTNIHN